MKQPENDYIVGGLVILAVCVVVEILQQWMM